MVNREILCVSSSVDWYQDQMHPGLEIIHSMLYSLLTGEHSEGQIDEHSEG
jgi:hypothetical protein